MRADPVQAIPPSEAAPPSAPGSSRRALAFALLLYSAACMAAFSPILRGRTVPAWDAFNYYAAEQGLIGDHARAGRLLLWNPWIGGGRPDGADPQVGAFSPLNVALGWLAGGSPRGFVVYWLFVWWLGGAGFLFFSRHLGAPWWASTLGAVGFTFSGFQIGHATHASVLQGMSFVPWILWRLDVSLTSRRRQAAVEAGALWGLGGLAAYPLMTISTPLFLAGWSLARATTEEAAGGRARLAAVGRAAIALALVAVVGLLVMLPAYYGFFQEFRGYDARVEPLSRATAIRSNALDPVGAMTVASAYVSFQHFRDRGMLRHTSPTCTSVYVPVTLLALALAALGGVRGPLRRWRWLLLGLGVLFLFVAFGPALPFRGWLYDLFPPTRYFRHATKYRGYFVLALLTLAMEACRDLGAAEWAAAVWRRVAGFALVGVAVAPIAIVVTAIVSTRESVGLRDAVAGSVALWLGTAAVAGLASRERLPRPTLAAALLTLGGVDLAANSRWNHRLASFDLPSLVDEWRAVDAAHRPALALNGLGRLEKSPFPNHYNNLNVFPKIAVLTSYGSFFGATIRVWFDNPELSSAATGDDRVWFSPAARTLPQGRDGAALLLRRATTAGVALALGPACGLPDAGGPLPAVAELPLAHRIPVRLLGYEPNRLALELEAPADGYVMVTERWAPGWTLRIDDRPARLCTAGLIFRGFAVAAGRHRVEMRFRPRGYPWLVALSWSLLAGVAVASAVSSRSRTSKPHRAATT